MKMDGLLTRALAVTLLLGGAVMTGCGDDDDDDGITNLSGTLTFPDSVGGGPAANTTVNVIDLSQAGTPQVASTTSDAEGKWNFDLPQSTSYAVVAPSGVAPSGDTVRVSGLLEGEFDQDKDLNGTTDIACQAGVSAVQDGSITGAQLDDDRIDNLEDCAAPLVATTDFSSGASVTAAANQCRTQTNDGANPA